MNLVDHLAAVPDHLAAAGRAVLTVAAALYDYVASFTATDVLLGIYLAVVAVCVADIATTITFRPPGRDR